MRLGTSPAFSGSMHEKAKNFREKVAENSRCIVRAHQWVQPRYCMTFRQCATCGRRCVRRGRQAHRARARGRGRGSRSLSLGRRPPLSLGRAGGGGGGRGGCSSGRLGSGSSSRSRLRAVSPRPASSPPAPATPRTPVERTLRTISSAISVIYQDAIWAPDHLTARWPGATRGGVHGMGAAGAQFPPRTQAS
jgi:hypothetical protein